ncbi:LacI family DNA-binding transcriptional regulator [Paractinoplanes atraurantiacus]|uniref:LacI family transcriptional regulator n=1 Tax=Paractinoplanes atraurantiacus TaxID=1036182 RepID=A0A285JP60_9ACTN|nr:LacI family DNA-binding transcriptional regulator [Actinoplanes atraurantiacus]SNY62094.1 LacI family transcriptional regulator [Actinoplanes atraurantiacus]
MKHPHRIREIAERAGLSPATVDRVLHERGGVRESTVRRVHHAIAALNAQEPPYQPTITVDVVVPRPEPVRTALTAEPPPMIRPRFPHDLAAAGHAQGLILDAPDTPEVVEAVGRLDIPVVTLGRDLPSSKRVAHFGPDDVEAGATAAYLVEQWLADRAGDVLVVRGDRSDSGFRAEMRSRAPNRRLLTVALPEVRRALAANPSVRAVYSTTSGNAEVVEAFAAERRRYDVFVAHDLDDENAGLLRLGKLSAVLNHDLRSDLRNACRAVLRELGLLSGPLPETPAAVQVITPMNISA